MSPTNLHYNIGGFRFRITGEETEAILRIPGFEPFRTTDETAEFTFHLLHEATEEALSAEEEELLYYSHSEGITYRFMRCTHKRYQFLMLRSNGCKALFLHYNPKEKAVWLSGSKAPDMLHFACWMAFGLLTVGKAIAVHASTIAYKGRGVLFLGESGTGKSTHTRLWRKHIPEVYLLNDDSPLVRMCDGTAYLYGSPWSGKTPCYRNERVELAAIVRLSQATTNSIRRLSTLEAINALYPSCPPAFSNDNELSGLICSTLSDILSCTPVYYLACLPDEAAARLSFETLFNPTQ